MRTQGKLAAPIHHNDPTRTPTGYGEASAETSEPASGATATSAGDPSTAATAADTGEPAADATATSAGDPSAATKSVDTSTPPREATAINEGDNMPL